MTWCTISIRVTNLLVVLVTTSIPGVFPKNPGKPGEVGVGQTQGYVTHILRNINFLCQVKNSLSSYLIKHRLISYTNYLFVSMCSNAVETEANALDPLVLARLTKRKIRDGSQSTKKYELKKKNND